MEEKFKAVEIEEDEEISELVKHNRRLSFLTILMLFVIIFEIPGILLGAKIYSNYRESYIDKSLEQKITNEIIKANVVIAPTTTEEKDGKILRSYYTGASGFVFKKEGNKYYVLTCYHVAEGFKDYEILIVPDSIKDYKNISSEYDNFKEYPVATLEYINEATDIAILSFSSEEEWPTLKIAKNTPKKGEPLVIIQNPKSQIGVVHYGKIISNHLKEFDCKDGRLPNFVIHHNVHTLRGSSGSAVMNKDMEVVGINIGGNTPIIDDNFIYGAMIPAEAINSAIENWQNKFRED